MAKQTINGDIELNGAVLGDATNIVFYSKEQQLTELQKQQARENIGAAAEGDTPEPYVLPAATTTTLGGIIVGTGLSVASDGTLAVSGSGQSVDWNDISNKPTFSSVATSGDYDDLSNTPTIPTSTSDLTNDSGFITSSDIPTIPTKTSDLTNDSGFITSSDIPTKTSDLTNDSGFITSSDIPTKTSDLTNDSGFITSSDIPTIPTKTSDLTNDSNFVSDSNYVHTDNNFTSQLQTKLNGIETGALANVQADWNQTNTSADDYIKNKPTIPSPYTLPAATTSTLGGIIVGTGLSISGDGTLTVSGSGQSVDWDDIVHKPSFATVATSGSYNDLSNRPTIPANTSDLTNDSGFITSSDIPAIPTIRTYSVIITRNEWTTVGDHGECDKRVEGLSASSVLIASPAANSMINAAIHRVFVSNQTDDVVTFTISTSATSESIPTFQFDLVEIIS